MSDDLPIVHTGDSFPIVHTGDSFEESPYKEEHRLPYVTAEPIPLNPDHELFAAKPLVARIDRLEELVARLYDKLMDKPIDLDA